MTNIKDKLRNNEISLESALEKFELSSYHIADGDLNNLQSATYSCGFSTLDDFEVFKKGKKEEDGELIVLGARPGTGKSSFLLQIAMNMAKTHNVLFISLEMGFKGLQTRALALDSNKPLKYIKEGLLSKSDIENSQKRMSKLNLRMKIMPEANINEIRSTVRDHNKHMKLDLVIVDYLQIVEAPEQGIRSNEVRMVTQDLKNLAIEIGAPVLVASQLNRNCEERGKKMQQFSKKPGDYRPVGSDIAECGKVENIADVIVFLSRQEIYDGTRPGIVDVGIYKNRNGATGWVEFEWNGAVTKFIDRGIDL